MNGTMPQVPSGETIRGRLLVTDPGQVLPGAPRESGDQTAWLGRLVWLVSGIAGPEPPDQPAAKGKVVRLGHVAARYERAVQEVFASRMNTANRPPKISNMDLTAIQTRWMAFLDEMERSLPGISSTARHLPASLVFGLQRIVGAGEVPEGFTYSLNGIEALARYLVRRMANARAAMLFSSREARKRHDKQRILNLLSQGGLAPRDIYHPLHLTAATCQEILFELESEHLVKRCGKQWERIEGATLPVHYDLPLPLEI